MKILWLSSWYPHSTDHYDGDFIERHAKALSIIQSIDLIHVVQNTRLLINETNRTENRTTPNLNVQIVYVPVPKTPLSKLSAALFNRRYYLQLRNTIKAYIQENGVPDLVHVHVPVKIGVGALWLQRKLGIPFVVSEHANIYHQRDEENFNTYSPYFRFIAKRVFEKSALLFTVSDYLGKAINDVAVNKAYQVIPNVVDTNLFKYQAKTKPNPVFRFLHVSNLYPVKEPQLMLDAIQLFIKEDPQAEFVFIGNQNSKWEKQAHHMGIPPSKIHFQGEISYPEVAQEMNRADAFFLYSRSETFSCVTAEALCTGLPVVSANTGAIPEILNDENGIMTDPGDAKALAKALLKMKQNHQQFHQQQIAEKAALKYNYKIVAEQILAAYQQVLKKP